MEAIVLAGNTAPPELQELGVERIYMLKAGGETLLARICRCLIAGGDCNKVWVMAPQEVELPDIGPVERATSGSNVIENLLNCARNHCTAEGLLVSSSDLPAATPDGVKAIAQFAAERPCDAVYHVVERSVVEQAFPGTKRTYVKLNGKSYTGGNVFWLRREWLLEREPLLTEFFENRKNVAALAGRFGLLFLLRVLLGWADIPYLERHLGRVLQARVAAAVLPYPELAVDLDKPADLELFRPMLDPF